MFAKTSVSSHTNLSRWLFLAGLACFSSCQSASTIFENNTGSNESRPRVFSPRMDYDEWTPLGRGDPLKNNPTFDYVPPVLDRVQYWLESHTTEPSTKKDILVLGVTAKKTSPKIPEQFLKFVDGPKFARPNQDGIHKNDFTGSTGAEPPKIVRTTSFRSGPSDYRNQNRIQSLPTVYYPSLHYDPKAKPYTMMLPPPIDQKLVEPSSNFNAVERPKDKTTGYADLERYNTQTEEGPIFRDSQFYSLPSSGYSQHRSPPPPPVPSPASPPRSQLQSSSKAPTNSAVVASNIEVDKSAYTPPPLRPLKTRYEPTTPAAVSFEKSNLIYQSTQTLSGSWLGNSGSISPSTIPDGSEGTWHTPDYPASFPAYEADHHVAASSNHEVVVGHNTNIIVDGESNEKEEVVVGLKEAPSGESLSLQSSVAQSSSSYKPDAESNPNDENTSMDGQDSPKMHIVVANSSSTYPESDTRVGQKNPVTVVIPTNYVDKRANSSGTRHPEVYVSKATSMSHVQGNLTTTEKVLAQETSKSQSAATTMIVPPAFPNTPVSSPPSDDLIPSWHHPPHSAHPPSPPLSPPRHSGGPPHSFVPPSQGQMTMHHQMRPNLMTHYMMGTRPSGGFRPPPIVPMSHMSPPMAHIHVPSTKTVIAPPMDASSANQLRKRPPQMQPFHTTFAADHAPASTSLILDALESNERQHDRQRVRLPGTTMRTTVHPPFASTMHPTPRSPAAIAKLENPATNEQSTVDDATNPGKAPTTSTQSSSTDTPQTTTVPNPTTDPIFSHYKQPAKPIRGPMYLIFQGHSKVKTYKPTITKHGATVENNEIVENVTERQLSKLEQFINENTKSTSADSATQKKKQQRLLEEKQQANRQAVSSQDSLMSLVESGLDGFTLPPSASVTPKEQPNSVTVSDANRH